MNTINIDAVSAFDLGLHKMSAPEAKDASIAWAVDSICTFFSTSASVSEKLDYVNDIVSGGSLRSVVLKMVSERSSESYRSVFPAVEYR